MNPGDRNVALLDLVAGRLGDDLCSELVFVGGAVTGVFVTDPAMPASRPTEDVDVICPAVVLTDYHRIEDRLAARGFVHDVSEGAPICRWRLADSPDVIVDVMPTIPSILGFSNRWYPLALATATKTRLPTGRAIRLPSAPVFLATKLEAFAARGNADYLASHDLEDVLTVIDGRASLIDECQAADAALGAFLSERFAQLLATRDFRDALPGHLPADAASQARLPDLIAKLERIAVLGR